MIFWTDDPERDADRHDAEQEKRLKDCPICGICGEPIQDEYAYYLGSDDYVHEECILQLRVALY